MKIVIILFLVIAVLLIFYAIFISLKSLKQVKKQAKEEFEHEQKKKIRHPQIDKELEEIARQREKLNQRKCAKK